MGALMRAHNWHATRLGPPRKWPASLSTLVSVMLGSSQAMFVAWGPDRILLYNDGYAELLGRKHPAALGRPLFDVWSEISDDLRPLVDQVYAGGSVHMDDISLMMERHGHVEEAHFAFSYSPVRDETGEVAGLFCTTRETTAQVFAERRAIVERERQQALLRQMPGFVGVVTGADHVYEFVNDAYVTISERSDFIGRKFRDVFADLEEQAFATLLDEVYTTGKSIVMRGMELRLHGSAETQFIDFLFEPIRDDAGDVTGVFIGGYEVTEAYRATEALRASEARLRELNTDLERQVIERTQARGRTWQVSPDLMGAVNAQGHFETSNPAWKAVLGWTEEEVAGMSIFELLHPDDIERTRDAFNLSQQGHPTIRFPNRYRCKDGSYRWISWIGVPEDGMIYCTGRDITEEKAAEAELANAQEALRQSQKMEAVGQLTGGVAHDFNNLLTVIKSSTDLLKRPDLQEERRQRYIGAISDTVERAAKLTGQLLAFARRQSLRPEVFDVSKGVSALSDMIGTLTGSRIEIVTDLPDAPCFINADPSQFDTAIVNMAVNARDAMNGEGRLSISVHSIESIPAVRSHAPVSGDFVAVCIEDTGSGIAPDDIERIFEPFFTTKEVGHGTGLGLSQVFGFAKQSGGEVRVQSEVGKGTLFVLYLPRVEAVAPAATIEPEPLIDGHGTRVLVVEDNIDVGTFATQALAELGYETIWTTNAEAALSELVKDATSFDVVFSDVVMPGMNGIDLGHEIRRLYHDLPVVLASGYSHVLAQNGTYGFELLHKPYSIEQLSRTLRKVASWRQSKRAN